MKKKKYDRQSDFMQQIARLEKQNAALEKENDSLKNRLAQGYHAQSALENRLKILAEEIQKLVREKDMLEKDREKEIHCFTELENIHQQYVDENLRKEEHIAALEHKIQVLMEK